MLQLILKVCFSLFRAESGPGPIHFVYRTWIIDFQPEEWTDRHDEVGIRKTESTAMDETLSTSYSLRTQDFLSLLKTDLPGLKKITDHFAVIIFGDLRGSDNYAKFREILQMTTPREIFISNCFGPERTISAEDFPEMSDVPTIRYGNINHNLDLSLLVSIPRVEDCKISRADLEEIFEKFVTGEVRILHHVYCHDQDLTLDEINDFVEEKGGEAAVGNNLPTWQLSTDSKKMEIITDRHVMMLFVEEIE